jgi:hypothetical protein
MSFRKPLRQGGIWHGWLLWHGCFAGCVWQGCRGRARPSLFGAVVRWVAVNDVTNSACG